MKFLWAVLIALSLQSCSATPLLAQGVDRQKVLLGIIGEAEGLPIMEQEAIGRAILNRGSLQGVYGYKRVSGVIIAPKVREKAISALNKAMRRDITNGATHWLSNWDLTHCRPSLIAWHTKMKETLVTKHFHFYRRT